MVRNVHERHIEIPIAQAREALATLATDDDRVWPLDAWPPMRFESALIPGARGGHGAIRYEVLAVSQDRVEFAFLPPVAMLGTHRLELRESATGTIVRHVLDAAPTGVMHWAWPLVVEPLHNAVIEDAFDRLELDAGRPTRASWSRYVRTLRSVFRWFTPAEVSPGQRAAAVGASSVLAGVAALHLLWATGRPWPLSSRERLGEVVVGTGHFPPAPASAAVAALTGLAAAVTAQPSTSKRRALALGASAVLAARGTLGHTALRLLPGITPQFRRADRLLYSPLCLALSAAIVVSLAPGPDVR